MYLLDTNTVRYGLYEPDNYPLVVDNLNANNHLDIWISVITVQELIEWRYNPLLIASSQQPPYVLRVYKQFFDILEDICDLQVKPFDSAALKNFSGMPGNVGVHDRRIAAIALAGDLTVVSHDDDFAEIKKRKPQLKLVDWVTTPPTNTI